MSSQLRASLVLVTIVTLALLAYDLAQGRSFGFVVAAAIATWGFGVLTSIILNYIVRGRWLS